MNALTNKTIAAIIPALNEEAYVADVLKVLLSSKYFKKIILVDDGSEDKTAEVAKELGVKVVKLSKIGGSGKGNAIRQGLKETDADIIALFDADLIGLKKSHIAELVEPVLKGEASMSVGIRDRLAGLPSFIANIDHYLAIGGERVMDRPVLEMLPEKWTNGYALESALNYFCGINNLSVKHILLKGLNHVTKEKKWGIIRGFVKRIKMTGQIIKARIKFLFFSISKKNV